MLGRKVLASLKDGKLPQQRPPVDYPTAPRSRDARLQPVSTGNDGSLESHYDRRMVSKVLSWALQGVRERCYSHVYRNIAYNNQIISLGGKKRKAPWGTLLSPQMYTFTYLLFLNIYL